MQNMIIFVSRIKILLIIHEYDIFITSPKQQNKFFHACEEEIAFNSCH